MTKKIYSLSRDANNVECYQCGVRFSNKLRKCPNCGIRNEDFKKNNFTNRNFAGFAGGMRNDSE